MEIALFLVVGFVLFQMYQGGGRTWRSMAELEKYLNSIKDAPTDDVHKYDVLGPF